MSVNSLGRTGLPVSTSEFIGRTSELARIRTLLRRGVGLITLVGPGGIGKSRLAAEALRAQVRPVGRLALAELESDAVCVDSLQSVAGATVLVLDNCERMLARLGPLIAELLDTAPGSTIIATSTEPIGLPDEHIVEVPPLSIPDALEVFRRRAERAGRPVPDDPDMIAMAVRICRHVDHNPLFIGMAAARLRQQPMAAVLRELSGDHDDRRLRWSLGARAGVEPRHRGIADTIAWSYALCGPQERLLLERMSVFAPGFPAGGDEMLRNGVESDVIQAVCADDDRLPSTAIEPLLDQLAERSLLSTYFTHTEVRWYLTESVRIFARDRWQRRDPDEVLRFAARHRRYYRDALMDNGALRHGARDRPTLDWVRAAWDNLSLGIETALDDPAEALIGVEMSAALMSLWAPLVHGDADFAERLADRALERRRVEGFAPVSRVARASLYAVGGYIMTLVEALSTGLPPHGSGGAETTWAAREIAQLVGAGRAYHRAAGFVNAESCGSGSELRRAAAVSSAVLGVRGYAAAEREGAQRWRDFEDVRRHALDVLRADPDPVDTHRRGSGWDVLSDAEHEVAVLVAAGWPNSAIAVRRHSSVRTVDVQVAVIRQKLKVASRNEIAALVPDELTDRVRREAERRPRRNRPAMVAAPGTEGFAARYAARYRAVREEVVPGSVAMEEYS